MMLAKALSPTEVSELVIMRRHIGWILTKGLIGIVEEAVQEIMEQIEDDPEFEGTAVDSKWFLRTMNMGNSLFLSSRWNRKPGVLVL